MFQIQGIEPYIGGKSGSGVYQTIINELPPHRIYVEPFLGMGAILRYKRLAELSVCADLDGNLVYQIWQMGLFAQGIYNVKVHHKCGMDLLEHIFNNTIYTDYGRNVLVYADPPYPIPSRKGKQPMYKHEMTLPDHERLLKIVTLLPFNVAISSYNNDMYNHYLANWRKIEFTAQTRRGPATEVLYMNYPQPATLHDYSYLGTDYRERERIQRKILRHVQGLKRLPALERAAILQALTQNIR